MKTKYFFRQLEALDFWCIVDNSCGGQRSRWAGWQSLRGTHPLLWWHGHGSCVRRYTYLFWSGWWNVLRWSWPYRETATRQNHAGNRGTYGILCCRKYKWCVLFWQCCMVLYNHTPIGLLPCVLLGIFICPGQSVLFRGSARRISWQGCCPLTVNVIADFFKRTLISWIIRDQGFGKVKFIFKKAVSFNCIKRGIAQKGIGMKMRVHCKVIWEYRF